jgi:acyl carrier protein
MSETALSHSRDEVVEKLRLAYQRVSQRGPSDVPLVESARLREDLQLDSYAAIELVFELEDSVGVRIPNEAVMTFRTVGDVVAFVLAEQSAAKSPVMESAGGAGAA